MKAIGFLAIFFLATSSIYAQALRGGFGHGFSGPWIQVDIQLHDDLRTTSLLGQDLQQAYFGYSGGGSGYLLLANRMLIGGTGFSSTASDVTNRGQLTTKFGGGIGQIGYLLLRQDRWMAFPYVGIGHNDIKMKIHNSTTSDNFDLGNVNVKPGETIELRTKTVDFDLGFSTQFFVFQHQREYRKSGFMLGLQAGAYAFIGTQDWHVKDEVNQFAGSLSKPSMFMPYFRITIGGGGFCSVIKDETSARQ